MDERWFGSEFQIFGATDEKDLEVDREVLRGETHIDMDEEESEWSHRCIPWNEYSEVRGLLKLYHPVSDGSYLEVYYVTNGKPVQLRQNRRDMIKARFLGHNACMLGYSEQAGGGPVIKIYMQIIHMTQFSVARQPRSLWWPGVWSRSLYACRGSSPARFSNKNL